MKKLIYTLLFVLISVAANGQQAKYVFYFIGDGMGVNQVNGTEFVAEKVVAIVATGNWVNNKGSTPMRPFCSSA